MCHFLSAKFLHSDLWAEELTGPDAKHAAGVRVGRSSNAKVDGGGPYE